MRGSPLAQGPIGTRQSCETLTNLWLQSNVANPHHGATSFSDPPYLWCARGDLKEGQHSNQLLGAKVVKDLRHGIITEHQSWGATVRSFSASPLPPDVEATRENHGNVTKLALNCRWPLGDSWWGFVSGPSWMCCWDLKVEWTNNPWIPTSRGLSCSTTAWISSPRTSRPQCASTRYQTLSTSSTRASTASCRRGPLTASATSSAARWWGWARRAPPPPCCPGTPPWPASDPPSPARPSTTTESTPTPTWEGSPSREASVPWRAAVWAAGRRAAATGEQRGSSAPTVSQHPQTHTSHTLRAAFRGLGCHEQESVTRTTEKFSIRKHYPSIGVFSLEHCLPCTHCAGAVLQIWVEREEKVEKNIRKVNQS